MEKHTVRAQVGLCIAALLFAGVVVQPAFGQELTATIRGTVIDPSGGAVPGANVQAVNQSTHVSTSTVSNADGSYVLLHLPAGTYDVTVTKTGFQGFTAHNIVLTLNAV